jgi:hypothetical protein
MIHYRSKTHYKYPDNACGRGGVNCEHTDIIEDVTCSTCKRSYKKIMPPVKSRSDKGKRKI